MSFETLLRYETEKIKDEEVKRFVNEALDNVDPKFWTAPSSSSGKYHPVEDNGWGGLVRHVVKTVYACRVFAREKLLDQDELDAAVAAAILHDVCKNGIEWNDNTDYTHGKLAYGWLDQFRLDNRILKKQIKNGVRYHMGQWCYVVDPFEERRYTKEELRANIEELRRALTPRIIEEIVQEADYVASRETMSYFPGMPVIKDDNKRRHDGLEEWFDALKSLEKKL